MKIRKAYLDIDWVILTKKDTRQADNLYEFISTVTQLFDCYWLTTRCKWDSEVLIRHLSDDLDENIMEKIKDIKPTNWQDLKTEVIDMTNDFLWFDDCPFLAEIEELKSYGKLKNLVIVDLNRPDELKTIIKNCWL